MALFFQKKISVIHYFLCLEFVLISLSSIRMAKICQFLINHVTFFLHFVSPFLLEITIMVHEKNLKKYKDFQVASLACIIESMSKVLIFL